MHGQPHIKKCRISTENLVVSFGNNVFFSPSTKNDNKIEDLDRFKIEHTQNVSCSTKLLKNNTSLVKSL